jgi:hypothetical protein
MRRVCRRGFGKAISNRKDEAMRKGVVARFGPYEVTLRAKAGKFIREFTKTPEGIFCPHFWLMSLGQACPFG